jgi:hypothetical protein
MINFLLRQESRKSLEVWYFFCKDQHKGEDDRIKDF